MYFVYPYKIKRDTFDITHSIASVLNVFPSAQCITIGDAVPGVENIPCNVISPERGVDVTNKILTFARMNQGDFIYMNDDFYINHRFNPDAAIFNGQLSINSAHAPGYQMAMRNTMEFLQHLGVSINNFECHQPVKMNCEKLITLFDAICWNQDTHFIKSIYLNVYKPELIEGVNLKLKDDNLFMSNAYLNTFGCFSTSDEFKSKIGIQFIKNLTASQ
jgi:hypothetical protein